MLEAMLGPVEHMEAVTRGYTLDVVPGDLDLAVDDPWVVGAALGDLLVEPVTRMTGWVADAGGRAFHGAVIE